MYNVSYSYYVLQDQFIQLDGRLNAPTGTANYPTYFTSLNGISPYPVRPPWKVAGVDYRVGINTGVSFLNPNTISSSIATVSGPLGTNDNTNTLNLQQDATFDSYDFTLSGGYSINTNGFNLTVTNSKGSKTFVWAQGASVAKTVTVSYCEIDGGGINGGQVFGTLFQMQNFYTTVLTYNWLKNAFADTWNSTANGDITAKYNLIDGYGFGVGSHPDAFQWSGDGTANNILIRFNTCVYGSYSTEGPSSFIDLEPQTVVTSGIMNNPEVGNNVASYTAVATPNITGAVNNGSGLIRLTVTDTAPFLTGDLKYVSGVGGVPNATGQWTITVVSAGAPGTIDLQGSTFAGSYTSGGTIRSIGAIWFRQGGNGTSLQVNNLFFHDNYCDVGEPWQFGPGAGGAVSEGTMTGYRKSGNILLNSGASF